MYVFKRDKILEICQVQNIFRKFFIKKTYFSAREHSAYFPLFLKKIDKNLNIDSLISRLLFLFVSFTVVKVINQFFKKVSKIYFID